MFHRLKRNAPSRLCLEESKVFLFFAAVFSHILTCFASDTGTKVRPQIAHGWRGSGRAGCGATGATGFVGTGGEGTRFGSGDLWMGRNESSLETGGVTPRTGGVTPRTGGSGDGDLEFFEVCSCWCCRLPRKIEDWRCRGLLLIVGMHHKQC